MPGSSKHDTWHSGQIVQSLFYQTREFCFSWSDNHSGAFWQQRAMLGFLVICLTKALNPRLLSLAAQPDLGRLLVVPNLFHLRMMEATVLLGTFNAAERFLYPSPDLCLDTILSRRPKNNFWASWLGFLSGIHYQL